jgi:hypothetical protein
MRHVFKAGKYWTIGLRIEDIIGPSFRRSSTLEFPMRDRQWCQLGNVVNRTQATDSIFCEISN